MADRYTGRLRERVSELVELDAVTEEGTEALAAALRAVLDVAESLPDRSPLWEEILQRMLRGEQPPPTSVTQWAEGHSAGLADARAGLRTRLLQAIEEGLR